MIRGTRREFRGSQRKSVGSSPVGSGVAAVNSPAGESDIVPIVLTDVYATSGYGAVPDILG